MALRRGPAALASERHKRSRSLRVLLGAMFRYIGQFKKSIVIAAVFTVTATILQAIGPVILAAGINLVLTLGVSLGAVLNLGIIYVMLRVTSWLLSSLYTWILAGAQAGFVRSLQQDIYKKLVHADLSYHRAKQSGDITSRVTTDTDNLAAGIQIVINFSSQMLLLIATFVLMWLVSPLVAITSLVVVPVIIIIVVLFGTVGQRIMLASQRATGFVSGQIAENLSGIHIAKAFNREAETARVLNDLNRESYRHSFRFMMLMTLLFPLVRATGIAAVALVLFVGGSLAVGAAPLLTIGEVFLGIILVQRFLMPLLTLSMMATQFQASLASMDRLLDVLEAEPLIHDSGTAVPLNSESDGITFENVAFSYVDGAVVLEGVNFTVQPGELIAIVGHTGAGKTTIAALINRFYDPQSGSIRIGQQDIRMITLKSLHDNVALIAQEPYLFDDTVMENIRYGRPNASDEEILSLSKLIGAHDFIEVLPQSYRTDIYEGGKNLSAGQVQMISIARTMLADPKILILDEATSRLDAYSESLVQAAQEKLFSKRTTVVIAHRLTTIANASRVLVFEHGKLVEEGTHDTYYAHQMPEEISEETIKIAQKELAKKEQQSKQLPGSGMERA
jgi:ABC-type multidrug transport system fused ATPase/permease subunit